MKKLMTTAVLLAAFAVYADAQVTAVRIDVNGKFEVSFSPAAGLTVTVDYKGRLQDIDTQLPASYSMGEISRAGNIGFDYYFHDQVKKIGGTQVLYDQENRIRKIGGTEFTYTIEGQVVLIGKTAITYDPNGRIVKIGDKTFSYDDMYIRSGERNFMADGVKWFLSNGF